MTLNGEETGSLIDMLAQTDELQEWGRVATIVPDADRNLAFKSAVPIWIKRMVSERKLLLHPDVIKELQNQNWQPTDLQKKMIWASIVCKLDRPEQKSEKSRIRKLLQNKYDNDWWEDVYQRAGKVWPAWNRAQKRVFSNGSAINALAAHSSLIGQALDDEYQAVLRMVPKE